MSRPDPLGPPDFRLGFARARLGALLGCPIVGIEAHPGVRGMVPALIIEAPDGSLVALLALSDEEGNDDGTFELAPLNALQTARFNHNRKEQ